jgi:hypothetical protein
MLTLDHPCARPPASRSLHPDPIAETEIVVLHHLPLIPQARSGFFVPLQPLQKVAVAEPQFRRSPSSSTTAFRGFDTSSCDIRRNRSGRADTS